MPYSDEKIVEAFESDLSAHAVSRETGVSRGRVLRLWKEAFGDEAVRLRGERFRGSKGKAWETRDAERKQKAIDAYHLSVPLKEIALELGVHYTRLRDWWNEEFGADAVKVRGNRLRAEKGRRRKGETLTQKIVGVSCSRCGAQYEVTALSIAKSATLLCPDCKDKKRVPTPCPVCGLVCEGPRGLSGHFRHQADDREHQEYLSGVKERGREDEDYVTCRVCGYQAKTLVPHLKCHGLTIESYREQWPDALTVCRTSSSKRVQKIKESHVGRDTKGFKKRVTCPTCGTKQEVSAYSRPVPCPECKEQVAEARWDGKQEGVDFVSCRRCGYRAENLTAHIQNAHPDLVRRYRMEYPGAPIVASGSAVCTPSPLRGRTLSDETKAKMVENAGRWNKGLTKETDSRVATGAEKMKGRPSWSKGLTAKDHESLQRTSEKLKQYVGEKRSWNNGLKLNLTQGDFDPWLDREGQVDRAAMAIDLDVTEEALNSYMRRFGLRNTHEHVLTRAANATIRLAKAELEAFALQNGKIVIGRAMSGLGHSYQVIRRECDRHGLETFHARIRQTLCLDKISEVLGVPYKAEWQKRAFVNPLTGYMFKFDGYFESLGLIVEFHGYQHWAFPNVYFRYEEERDVWEAMLERDRVKQRLVEEAPGFRYLCIREDEPFDDPDYLCERLRNLGLGAGSS